MPSYIILIILTKIAENSYSLNILSERWIWSNKSFTNNRKSRTRDGSRKQNKGSKDKSKRKVMRWGLKKD